MTKTSNHSGRQTLFNIFGITVILAIAWTPYLQTLFPHVSYGDEGFIVQSAYRIYLGEVPYRDFFNASTPGSFYWTALFFELFGPTFLAVRIGTLVTASLILLCSCLILYRFNIRGKAPYLMVAAFFAYFIGPYWFIASHHWVSLLFCLVSFIFLLPDNNGKQKNSCYFISGIFAALVVFTMQHLGVFWVISACLAFLAMTKGERLQPFLWFLSGGFIFAIPVAGIFISTCGIEPLIYDLITFPLTRYHEIVAHKGVDLAAFSQQWQQIVSAWPRTNSLLDISRFTTLTLLFISAFSLYILPFISMASLVYLWREASISRTVLSFLTAFFCAQYLTALNRIMDSSMVFAAPASVLIITLALSQWHRNKQLGFPIKKTIQTVWIVMFFSLFISGLTFLKVAPRFSTETPAGKVVSLNQSAYNDLQGLAGFFRYLKQPSDTVIFHPYSPMLYFLFQTENPTPYDTIVYPMNTQKQFKDFISILEGNKCKWVVLTTQDKGDPVLDYLAVNYQVYSRHPYSTVFKRR